MPENDPYPDCVRYYPENNSTLFAETNDDGEVVAIHEVFLDEKAREIGRRTTGIPEEGRRHATLGEYRQRGLG